MNPRVLLAGVLGGMVVQVAARYPLYDYLPSLFVKDWPPAAQSTALLMIALAAVGLAATGAVAARFSGQRGRASGAAAGAVAGLVAALMIEIWWGGAAAGAWGNRQILAYGLNITPDEATFMRLIIDGVLSTYAWTYASLWIAAAVGLGLGALGGWLVGAGGAPATPMTLLWPTVSVAGILAAALPTLVSAIILSLLGPNTQQAADQINYVPALSPGIFLTLAMLTNLTMLIAWQVIGWLAIKRAQPETAGEHTALFVIALVNGAVVVLTLVALLLVSPGALLNVASIVGALIALVVSALTLRLGWALRSRPRPPARPSIAQPSLYGWTAVLSGLAMILSAYASPTAASLNIVLLVIPFMSILAQHDAAALASQLTAGESVASFVGTNYTMHAAILSSGGLFVLVVAALAYGIAWVIQRWQVRRAAANPPTGDASQ